MEQSFLLTKEELQIIVNALEGYAEGLESTIHEDDRPEEQSIRDEIAVTLELKADLTNELKNY